MPWKFANEEIDFVETIIVLVFLIFVDAIIEWFEEMVEFDEFYCWKPFEMILITFDPLTINQSNGFNFWILVTICWSVEMLGHQTRWKKDFSENERLWPI